MSTTANFVRIGNHVLNMSSIDHIWFDEVEEGAFIDFGWHNSEGWDLILIGADARALKAHFDREGEAR